MRICVILEGCYPYVTGGVSSWMQQYMEAMPEHEFVVWTVGADSSEKGNFKYTLPANVVEVRELFLNDALSMGFSNQKYSFSEDELEQLHRFINCGNTKETAPDWEKLFHMYHDKKVSPIAFLTSEDFLDVLVNICEEEYPYTAFSDLFHTVRSMLLPVLYIMQSEVPKADLYHAIATGYSGVLARLGSYVYNVPYMVTEHGIYTREREEEIIRAKWVLPAFKRFWVRFFYMLSHAAYSKASMVTSLFERARQLQIAMGVDPDGSKYILNGIHYDRFASLPLKKPNGYIDIGAILRIAPIKDIKTMIYAFSELKQRVPNARLYICGPEDDEVYAKECYDLIEQLGVQDITFTGAVDVLEWYEKFDFTLLTSISEGQPLVVLESFAAGVPCVTTDVGCCKELIGGIIEEDDLGPAGYCVPPMHRQALSDVMERMCTHPEERYQMGQTGKRRTEKYFRHRDMIRNYKQTYDEVLEKWQA